MQLREHNIARDTVAVALGDTDRTQKRAQTDGSRLHPSKQSRWPSRAAASQMARVLNFCLHFLGVDVGVGVSSVRYRFKVLFTFGLVSYGRRQTVLLTTPGALSPTRSAFEPSRTFVTHFFATAYLWRSGGPTQGRKFLNDSYPGSENIKVLRTRPL